MDNKAYSQYQATQPKFSAPERAEAPPPLELSTVEITILVVFIALVIWAIYRIIKNFRK